MSNTNLGTGTFYITGNASGATNAANQANNALAKMEQVVAQNWWGIQNLGLAFAALPSAVAAGTGAAIKSAIEWQDAMAAVARTTYDAAKSEEENAAAANNLGKELLAMSQRIPTSALGLAQIAEAAGALGVAGPDVAQFTETVANLANVTDLTEQTAAVAIARIAALTGVGAAGFDNLASAITTAGVTTSATESEIAALATRIAGAAKIVGLTADEVIALAAATRSAGVQVEAGGTAIQKTFFDINAAVRGGGKALQGWAQIANISATEFKNLFAEDSAQAFLKVIEGLGRINDAGGNVIGMLGDLGVTEQRQVRTLLSLSAAQNQNVNDNVRLSTILGVTSASFQDTQKYSEMLERRYNTLANQLQILKNQLFAAAQGFGSALLPVVREAVGVLQNMIAAVMSAPGPIKALMGISIGLATVLAAVGAAALLIGPRILIAHSALKQLEASSLSAARAQQVLEASQAATSVGALRSLGMTNAQIQALNAQQRAALGAAVQTGNLANVERAAAAAGLTLNEVGLTSVTTMGTMITWAGRAASAFGWITLAVTLATTALAFFNRKNQEHQKGLEASSRARLDMISAMRQEAKGQEGATKAFVTSMPIYQRLSQVAQNAGVSQETLYGIISGGVDDVKVLNDALRRIGGTQEKFAEGQNSSLEILGVLQQQYQNSAQEAGFMGNALDKVNLKIAEQTTLTKEDVKQLKAQADAASNVAEAENSLPGAMLASANADAAVTKAEKDLVDARKAEADWPKRVAAAERDLEKARLAQKDAAQSVIDAEQKVADASRDAANEVADAEDALADTRDRRADTIDKISDLEKKLADLREGPSTKDLTKATNDLRQAQLNLLKTNQQVSDSEWYLNYLREEGASNRDIQDAQTGLEQAKIDQTDATTSLADAEQKLNDLMDDTQRQKDIAKAERDLASARRDLEEIDRNLTAREHDLQEARKDQAGRLLDQREEDLAKARLESKDAADAVTKAEEDLDKARDNSDLIAAREQAERDLEGALYDQADAHVEVRKQMTLAAGGTWDAAKASHALSEELGKVVGKMPTDAANARLQNFVTQLKNIPNIPIVPEISEPDLPDVGDQMANWGNELGTSIGDAITQAIKDAIDKEKADKKGDSWWSKVWDWLWDPDALGRLWDKSFEVGRDIVNGIIGGIEDIGKGIGRWISEKWDEWIYQPARDFFGIHSPSTLMQELGRDIIRGLINGLIEKGADVLNFFVQLPGLIWGLVKGASSWLVSTGESIIVGLWNGINNKLSGFWNMLMSIPNGIWSFFKNASTWLLGAGADIMIGLWNGIVGWFNDHFSDLWDSLIDAIPGHFADSLKMHSPSQVFEEFGNNIIQGLINGLADDDKVAAAMQALSDSMVIDTKKFVPFSAEEILAGSQPLNLSANPNIVNGASGGGTTINNYTDQFNLEAHTDADPDDIVNTYFFAKRVRTRA